MGTILIIRPKGKKVLGSPVSGIMEISDGAPVMNYLGGIRALKVWVVDGAKVDRSDFQYIFSRFREVDKNGMEILVPPYLYGTLIDALMESVDDSKLLLRPIPDFMDRIKILKRCSKMQTLSKEDILRKIREDILNGIKKL